MWIQAVGKIGFQTQAWQTEAGVKVLIASIGIFWVHAASPVDITDAHSVCIRSYLSSVTSNRPTLKET